MRRSAMFPSTDIEAWYPPPTCHERTAKAQASDAQRCSTQERASQQQGQPGQEHRPRPAPLREPRSRRHGEEGEPAEPGPELHENQRGNQCGREPQRQGGATLEGNRLEKKDETQQLVVEILPDDENEREEDHEQDDGGSRPAADQQRGEDAEGREMDSDPRQLAEEQMVPEIDRVDEESEGSVGEDQIAAEAEPPTGEEVQADGPGSVESRRRGGVVAGKSEPDGEDEEPRQPIPAQQGVASAKSVRHRARSARVSLARPPARGDRRPGHRPPRRA